MVFAISGLQLYLGNNVAFHESVAKQNFVLASDEMTGRYLQK